MLRYPLFATLAQVDSFVASRAHYTVAEARNLRARRGVKISYFLKPFFATYPKVGLGDLKPYRLVDITPEVSMEELNVAGFMKTFVTKRMFEHHHYLELLFVGVPRGIAGHRRLHAITFAVQLREGRQSPVIMFDQDAKDALPCIGDFGPKTGEIDWVATFGRFVKFNLYVLQPYEHRDKIDFALALNSRLAGILEGTKEHVAKIKG